MAFQTSFDYIVIGGGTAGLVVAARLSENPDVSVCVIEAGKDQSTNVDTMIPGECFLRLLSVCVVLTTVLFKGFAMKNLGNAEVDWMFQTTPQPHCNERQIILNRLVSGDLCLLECKK